MVVVGFGRKICPARDAQVRPLLSLLLPGPPGQLLPSTPLKRLPLQWCLLPPPPVSPALRSLPHPQEPPPQSLKLKSLQVGVINPEG